MSSRRKSRTTIRVRLNASSARRGRPSNFATGPPSPKTMAAAQQQQPLFAQNERVLCYHGPLIYEAKVLKAETWDETNSLSGSYGPHYFVHYKGWKQTSVSLFCVFIDRYN